MKSSLAGAALENAVRARRPSGTVLHSDRGSQAVFNRCDDRLIRPVSIAPYHRRRRQRRLGKLTPIEYDRHVTHKIYRDAAHPIRPVLPFTTGTAPS